MSLKKKSLIALGALVAVVAIACALSWHRELGSGPPPVASPDGNYEARVISFQVQWLFSREPVRARILIQTRDGIEVRRMVVSPLRTNDVAYFRTVPDLVRWEADSRTVTIAFDGAEHRITVDK